MYEKDGILLGEVLLTLSSGAVTNCAARVYKRRLWLDHSRAWDFLLPISLSILSLVMDFMWPLLNEAE